MEKCKYCELYDGDQSVTSEENKPLLLMRFFDFLGKKQEISVEIWDDELYLYGTGLMYRGMPLMSAR